MELKKNDVLWLNNVFAGVPLDDITCADANITYSEWLCWQKHILPPQMLFLQRVAHCRWWFLFNSPLPARWVQTVVWKRKLWEPVATSEFIYPGTALAVQHYMVILFTIEPTKTKFSSMSYPRFVFLKALINIIAATETLSDILFQQCFAGHLNFKEVVKSTFICFTKKELKRINAFKVKLSEISAKKLRKLTSKSSQF